MKAFLFSFCYNVLYTLGWLVTLPSYLLKQKRRGGFGTGLMERFGLYRVSYNREPKGVLYVHAVSVGEVVLALKFLRAWLRERGGSAVLATSTATGHDTAVNAQVSGVRVIYAPFDLLGLPGRCFDRFEPEAIVLVEAELWPNFARAAKVRGIPMAMINARMSARSESRYRAFKWVSRYYFSTLDAMGVQDKGDVRRFESVGVRPSIIHVTGSIKFDQQMAERKETNAEFAAILDKLKRGKPVVLAASTHDGEEVLIAEAVRKAGGFPLIVPRHAERRHTVVRELEARGWQCVLRTDGELPETLKDNVCYIADTTGELRDWTALADVAGGLLDLTFDAAAKPLIDAGRVKLLAVTGDKRDPRFPNTPTAQEAGLPPFAAMQSWLGLLAPAGTPAAMVERFNAAASAAVAEPGVQRRLADLGVLAQGGPASRLGNAIGEDLRLYRDIASQARLRFD